MVINMPKTKNNDDSYWLLKNEGNITAILRWKNIEDALKYCEENDLNILLEPTGVVLPNEFYILFKGKQLLEKDLDGSN